ncbi:MAG: biliverdin-producing heme oxygenase [Ginsengibacter sp.]
MLSEELKIKTKDHHQQLEVKIIAAIKSIREQNDYAGLLQIFAGYFGSLENLIEQTKLSDLLPDYPKRRKASSLQADLTCMRALLPAKIETSNLPAIENSLQALGALYVMEGSTLGGRIITRMVANKLPDEKAFSFFEGYGEKTNEMWEAFKSSLDAIYLTPQEINIIIESANETFYKFSLYFDIFNAG